MSANENLLSMAAFREATGASEATVSRWLKKGLPAVRIARTGGGRAQVFFDKSEAGAWVSLHGNQTARRRAIALAKKQLAAATDEQPGTVADGKPSTPASPEDDEGLIAALDRLRKQEIESHRLLIRLKKAGDLNGVLAVSERHLAEVKALGTLESAAVSFRVRAGELGPRREMQGVFEKVIVGIKNAVLGIPSNVIPQLIPFLRDPDAAHEVHTIIDRASRDALRSVRTRQPEPDGKPPPKG